MRDFLKYTFATCLGSCLGLLLFVGLGTTGLVMLIVGALATASQDLEPSTGDNAVLVFDLSVPIRDSQPELTTGQAIGRALSQDDEDSVLTLRLVLDTLDRAAEDDRIVGIYLHGGTLGTTTGFAILKEIRAALQRFRETSGKPIFAYDVDWTEREYYLGSVASEVAVNPLGMTVLNGFSSQVTFFKGALDKYGVGMQVVRVGKFKSAVEPFERASLSSENRLQTQKLLSDLWREFLQGVGEARSLPPQQLQAIADRQGFLLANEAKAQKLVDRVAHYDEAIATLREWTGETEIDEDSSFNQVSLAEYAAESENLDSFAIARANNRIALVYAEGSIVDGQGSPNQVGGDRLARRLRSLRDDEGVRAIVLRINSPGGSATASEVIQREVKLIRERKPIVVSMGNVAASGGYWIATYGTQILAEPNTITGSIGVFGLLPNVKNLANNNGITWDGVKTSKFADLETITRPKTPEEIARIQKIVNLIYERFLSKVSESRQLDRAKVAEIAQGRVWSGTEAQKLGLVDRIGGLEDAIATAAELAELENWTLDEYPRYRTLEEQIIESLAETKLATQLEAKPTLLPESASPVREGLARLQKELWVLEGLNDPFHAYTRMPLELQID